MVNKKILIGSLIGVIAIFGAYLLLTIGYSINSDHVNDRVLGELIS